MSDLVRNMERIEELAGELAQAAGMEIQVRWLPFDDKSPRDCRLQLILQPGQTVTLGLTSQEVEAFDATSGDQIRQQLERALEQLAAQHS